MRRPSRVVREYDGRSYRQRQAGSDAPGRDRGWRRRQRALRRPARSRHALRHAGGPQTPSSTTSSSMRALIRKYLSTTGPLALSQSLLREPAAVSATSGSASLRLCDEKGFQASAAVAEWRLPARIQSRRRSRPALLASLWCRRGRPRPYRSQRARGDARNTAGRVQLGGVITDAPWGRTALSDENLCDDCHICIKSCPTGFMSAKDERHFLLGGRQITHAKKAMHARCAVVAAG